LQGVRGIASVQDAGTFHLDGFLHLLQENSTDKVTFDIDAKWYPPSEGEGSVYGKEQSISSRNQAVFMMKRSQDGKGCGTPCCWVESQGERSRLRRKNTGEF
jgi:hypothetical protein